MLYSLGTIKAVNRNDRFTSISSRLEAQGAVVAGRFGERAISTQARVPELDSVRVECA
jgi:hypothetical protein